MISFGEVKLGVCVWGGGPREIFRSLRFTGAELCTIPTITGHMRRLACSNRTALRLCRIRVYTWHELTVETSWLGRLHRLQSSLQPLACVEPRNQVACVPQASKRQNTQKKKTEQATLSMPSITMYHHHTMGERCIPLRVNVYCTAYIPSAGPGSDR